MADDEDVELVLNTYHDIRGIRKIIELGDPDAGMTARFWAEDRGIEVVTVRKETRFEACKSVMRRRPDAVVAFPDASMALVSRAFVSGVQVCEVRVNEGLHSSGWGGGNLPDDGATGEEGYAPHG
jgi:hypothetical protein